MLEKVTDLVYRTGHIALNPSPADDQSAFKSAEGGSIAEFSPSITSHLDRIYKLLTASKVDFLHDIQHESVDQSPSTNGEKEEKPKPDHLASLEAFRAYMASPASSAMKPAKPLDLSAPISDYFISSSHNTYLTGNQLYSDAAASSYTHALLSGCRCVEIDVWDGTHDQEDTSDDDSSSESSSDEEQSTYKKAMKVKKSLARYNSVSKIEGKIGGKVNGLLGRKQTTTEAPSGSSDSTAATAATTAQDPVSPEPMVLHGHTLTKATTFRDVCNAIRDSAFVVSDLPVIISLEVHAGHDQQQMMVDIMEEAWKGYLVEIPTETEPMKTLPPLEKLRKKILIKAKWAPANPAEQIGEDIENFIEERQPIERQQSQNQEAGANTLTSKTAVAPVAPVAPAAPALVAPAAPAPVAPAAPAPAAPALAAPAAPAATVARSAVPAAPAAPAKKPSKTLHALSRLAVYTKGFHFSHFEQPEAKMPDHVFSLSENAAKNAHTKEREALFNHNRNFFMRVYPGGLRVNSSNLDPTFFWRTGAQIVALNWQSLDKGMMLNHGMFAGEQGWVLKPQGYKSTETKPNALVDRKLDLTIEVLAGQGISLPPGHTKEKSFHPYVSCSLHVEQPDEDATTPSEDDSTDAEKTSYKRTIKYSTGSNPDFREQKLQFPTVSGIDEELSFVRFKVKDDAIGRNATASWACIKLDRLQEGYRIIHLYDPAGQKSGGALLVRIVKDIH